MMRRRMGVTLIAILIGLGCAEAAVYFSNDAEDGLTCNENAQTYCNCDGLVTNMTSGQAPVHAGTRSLRMWDSCPRPRTVAGGTTGSNGAKCFTFLNPVGGAYYSAWYYLDPNVGWVDTLWKNNLQWKPNNGTITVPNCDGKVKAIIGFGKRNGIRQVSLTLQDGRRVGAATKPTFPAYIDLNASSNNDYDLRQITPLAIPTGQWFRIEAYISGTSSNGAFRVWHTSNTGTITEIFNISHADLDTLTKWCNDVEGGTRADNTKLYMLWNAYHSVQTDAQGECLGDPEAILYSDDIQITDVQLSVPSGGDTTPPNAPNNLTLTQPYPGHMQVSWSAPTGTGEQVDYATYNLERCQGFGCSTFTPVSGYNGTDTSFLDTGLLRGEEYTYRVQACDDEGSPLCGAYDTEIGNTTAGGLVAYWNADQGSGTTLTDVENTGTDHDGTLCNGATCPQQGPSWVAGHIGTNALSFDGTDDFVRVPDHSALDFTASQDFTAQLWVNTTQGTSAGISPRIIGKHDASGGGWSLNLHDGTTDAKWFGRLVVGGTAIPTAPLDGCSDVNGLGWTHLALRRQGTILSTFQNGVLCNSFTDASVAGSLASTVNLNMGIRSDDTSHPYAGSLDDVRLYNYARSDGEIAADASPGATLALTAWRLHGVDAPLGTWKSGTNRSRKLRHNGSVAWRFQIHNTSGASASTPIALQCKLGQGSYVDAPEYLVDQEGSLNTECALAKSCVQADQVLSAGPDGTSVPYLPLPAGTTNGDYVQGAVVTSATWPSVTLAANELTEIQFRTAAVDIPDGSTLCCRPGKGENTPLDNYNVGTIGEACVNLHAGAAGLW